MTWHQSNLGDLQIFFSSSPHFTAILGLLVSFPVSTASSFKLKVDMTGAAVSALCSVQTRRIFCGARLYGIANLYSFRSTHGHYTVKMFNLDFYKLFLVHPSNYLSFETTSMLPAELGLTCLYRIRMGHLLCDGSNLDSYNVRGL